MPTTYEELRDVDGTIYKGDKPYGEGVTPEEAHQELAADLGIAPHEIEWGRITPESLAPTEPIDLTKAPEPDAVDESALAVAAAEEEAKQAAAKVKEEEAAKKAAEEDITGILTELEEEPAAQLAAEEAAGIPAFKAQQADITGQISIKTAEYRQLQAQETAAKTAREGIPGFTLAEVSGQKAVIERQFLARKNAVASDLGLLQAQSLAISGKQIAAQAAVDRAIDLKYDSKRLELDTQKFLLDTISADLTKAEERQWDLRKERIDREEAEMEAQKQIDKDIQRIMLEAAVAGASSDELADISSSTTVLEATQKASPYLVEPEEVPTPTGGVVPPTEEEPLTINQIEQFRRSYGWTPPLGFTNSQLIQYMNDNPDATPEELEAGARQVETGEPTEPTEPVTTYVETVGHVMNTITDEERERIYQKAKLAGITKLFRSKWNDVKAYIESYKAAIEEAVSQGYSAEEIKQYILTL